MRIIIYAWKQKAKEIQRGKEEREEGWKEGWKERMNEALNKRRNEWAKKQTNEQTNDRRNERKNERTKKRMNKWMNEGGREGGKNERTQEWTKLVISKQKGKLFLIWLIVSCRLYLINSPVVRAETLKFQEKGVKDVVKDVFLPWYNAHRFLDQSVKQFQRVNTSACYKYSNIPSPPPPRMRAKTSLVSANMVNLF